MATKRNFKGGKGEPRLQKLLTFKVVSTDTKKILFQPKVKI